MKCVLLFLCSMNMLLAAVRELELAIRVQLFQFLSQQAPEIQQRRMVAQELDIS